MTNFVSLVEGISHFKGMVHKEYPTGASVSGLDVRQERSGKQKQKQMCQGYTLDKSS